jgi:hypothetical protein
MGDPAYYVPEYRGSKTFLDPGPPVQDRPSGHELVMSEPGILESPTATVPPLSTSIHEIDGKYYILPPGGLYRYRESGVHYGMFDSLDNAKAFEQKYFIPR